MDEVAAEAEAKADETTMPAEPTTSSADAAAKAEVDRKARNASNKRQSRRRQKEQAAAAAAGGAAHYPRPRGDAPEVEVDGVKAVCSWDHVQGCWLHGGNVVKPKPRGRAPKVDVDGVSSPCTWDLLQGCWLHPVDSSVMDWTDDGAAEEPAMDLEEGTGPDRTAVAAYSGPLASQGVPTPA